MSSYLKKIKNIFFYQKEKRSYKRWINKNEPDKLELEYQRKHSFSYNPKISIIVPMYNTKEIYFKQLVESLKKQTYNNWELCIADGSDEKQPYLEDIKNDEKIKYIYIGENKGISENTNKAIALATGDYYGFLDHDDILPEFSLYEVVKEINENRDADFFYSDEDKIIDMKNCRVDPHFKPDFSIDTLLSYNYICHFTIIKKELLKKIEGFKKEYDGSQDYDLILRATEIAQKIIHIPKILYHWRINENSVAANKEVKPYAYEAGRRAIQDHLERKRNYSNS